MEWNNKDAIIKVNDVVIGKMKHVVDIPVVIKKEENAPNMSYHLKCLEYWKRDAELFNKMATIGMPNLAEDRIDWPDYVSVEKYFKHPNSREDIRALDNTVGVIEEIGPMPVKLDHLWPTQDSVCVNTINKKMEGKLPLTFPNILAYGGNYYILDGHHTLAGAIIRGDKTFECMLYMVKQ